MIFCRHFFLTRIQPSVNDAECYRGIRKFDPFWEGVGNCWEALKVKILVFLSKGLDFWKEFIVIVNLLLGTHAGRAVWLGWAMVDSDLQQALHGGTSLYAGEQRTVQSGDSKHMTWPWRRKCPCHIHAGKRETSLIPSQSGQREDCEAML